MRQAIIWTNDDWIADAYMRHWTSEYDVWQLEMESLWSHGGFMPLMSTISLTYDYFADITTVNPSDSEDDMAADFISHTGTFKMTSLWVARKHDFTHSTLVVCGNNNGVDTINRTAIHGGPNYCDGNVPPVKFI